jgi:hypothetical protein
LRGSALSGASRAVAEGETWIGLCFPTRLKIFHGKRETR